MGGGASTARQPPPQTTPPGVEAMLAGTVLSTTPSGTPPSPGTPQGTPRIAAVATAIHMLNKQQQDRGKAKRALKNNSKYGEAQYVYRVCLTGGPCGGKSSSQTSLSKALTAMGYNVYFAPEVPTILMNGGCRYPGLAPEKKPQLTAFEEGIIQMQLQMERSFTRIASSTGEPSVVIFDRGLLDIPAYLPREAWLELLDTLDFTEEYFVGRYDIVLHLVTTAHGVEDVYELQKSNNPARQETAEQARQLCDKVFECWSLHPKIVKLENAEGFDAKLEKGTQAVLDMIEAKKKWFREQAVAEVPPPPAPPPL